MGCATLLIVAAYVCRRKMRSSMMEQNLMLTDRLPGLMLIIYSYHPEIRSAEREA